MATVVAVFVLVGAGSVPTATADEVEVTRDAVSFEVTNLQELEADHTIHGYRIEPACAAETVVLLLHGLSYTGEAWDFSPAFDHEYAYARILARHGYTVVAVDRLGYGDSTLEDGYQITSQGHGEIAAQIVDQLREEFDHVALGGHSAGAETSIVAAGLFTGVDALIPMGYHQFPSDEILLEFSTGDVPAALTDDYVYFLGTPERRAEMFFTEHADPEVVAADTEAAVLTPSGEILTIGFQSSRIAAGLVEAPVLLQLADSDRLFGPEWADEAAALYLAASSVTVDIVPEAGHTYMLHPSGPAAADRTGEWLASLDATPACTTAVSSVETSEADSDGVDPAAGDDRDGDAVSALPVTGGGVALLAVVFVLAGAFASRRGPLRSGPAAASRPAD